MRNQRWHIACANIISHRSWPSPWLPVDGIIVLPLVLGFTNKKDPEMVSFWRLKFCKEELLSVLRLLWSLDPPRRICVQGTKSTMPVYMQNLSNWPASFRYSLFYHLFLKQKCVQKQVGCCQDTVYILVIFLSRTIDVVGCQGCLTNCTCPIVFVLYYLSLCNIPSFLLIQSIGIGIISTTACSPHLCNMENFDRYTPPSCILSWRVHGFRLSSSLLAFRY